MPSITDYSTDRRLDILVLGPMGDAGNEPSTIKLQRALNALLLEPEMQALLTQHHVLTQKVLVPKDQTRRSRRSFRTSSPCSMQRLSCHEA